jgi:prepilin-type processing-associated H-X9-DG protein
VVMAIITILVAVLLPALGRAQQLAKSSKCKSNLKAFGQGLTLYSNQNDGFYCSGSFSPKYERSNCFRMGWVADLVNGGYSVVSELKCPSNEAGFSEVLCEIMTYDGDNQGFVGTYVSGEQVAKHSKYVNKMIKTGYMTNFTASWYLVRTGMLPNAWDSWLASTYTTPPITGTDADKMRVDYGWNCYGPLSQRTLDGSTAVSSMVPLLADGNLGAYEEATLKFDVPPFKAGEIGVEATSDGPRKFRQGNNYYAGGDADDYVVTMASEDNRGGERVWVGQDLVDFGVVHGGGNKRWVNIVFADGHCNSVDDKDNDTVIGFTGNTSKPGDMSELEKIFVGRIVSKRRSGAL